MEERIRRALAGRTKAQISVPRAAEGLPPEAPGGRRLTQAAVLVPLFEREGNPHFLLTRRTEDVRAHKGQISFPGGRRDPEDPSLLHTALRECEEELGIPAPCVRILGELDDLVTVTDFIVSPYVGLIPYPYPFEVNRREIAEVIEVPLSAFLSPEKVRVQAGTTHEGKPHVTYFFHVRSHIVWGATARIIVQLLALAYGYRPPIEDA
jgi:8-oxo-dGTP pyrophosphatase MutT (NUDIX family)